jgi:hypothetical protein
MSSFQMLMELWLEELCPKGPLLFEWELEDLEIEHIPHWKRDVS